MFKTPSQELLASWLQTRFQEAREPLLGGHSTPRSLLQCDFQFAFHSIPFHYYNGGVTLLISSMGGGDVTTLNSVMQMAAAAIPNKT